MSYDLYFRSCTSGNEPTWDDMRSYFQGRSHYDISDTEAAYDNEATGVTFFFRQLNPDKFTNSPVDVRGDRPYLDLLPVTFNINYLRPHTFGLEAEPEITRFVDYFDMLVYDPQIDGMTDGIYTPGGFLKGWNSGNDFAHSALFSASASTEIHSLPAATLEAHWRWNVGLDALRERYAAENLFVPQIWYVSYRGRLCSAVSWAEGADTALPLVDLILTYRSPSRLAKLAGGKPEQLVVKMSGVMPRLERFERRGDPYEHFIVRFGGSRAASDMAKLVEGRHGNWNELRRLNNARVLNAEIVDRYLSVAGRR